MALLLRRPQPWETLPDGSSVYDAVRKLARDKPTPDPPPSQIITRSVAPPVTNTPSLLTRGLIPDPVTPPSPMLDRDISGGVPTDYSAPIPAGLESAPSGLMRHNGRPVAVVGAGDPLQRDQQLLNAQLAYKAPRSTKDAILATVFGLINHGLPGAGAGLADYELNQNTRNRYAVGEDAQQTQGRIQRELLTRHATNEALDDEAKRNLENAQAQKALAPTTYKPDVLPGRDGYLRSIDTTTGRATLVRDSSGAPIKGKVNSTHEWRTDPSGKAELWETTPGEADRKVEGATNSTKDLVQTPWGMGTHDAAVTAGATAENRTYTRQTAEETKAANRAAALASANEADQRAQAHQQEAAHINSRILQMETELRGMGAVSPDDPNKIVLMQNLNQAKEQQAYEQRQADSSTEDGRKARAEALKYPVTRGDKPPVFTPGRDGKYHYTPDQIRQSLKPGQTYENVLQQLSSRPNVIIDQ